MNEFMNEAILEAKKGLMEGGIPIGAVLVKGNVIIGRGHNKRVQENSAILHAEIDCLENAGRLTANNYKECVLYSTLSPCSMCSGAIVLYKIPKVIIGENETFKGAEDYMKSKGVKITNLDLKECKDLMKKFIKEKPSLWNEDIGV
ncbi:tRNA-specific adenosine deaminase [archaeon CG_4_10_14_0_2_um_filter_Archaea_38_6]|nr:MAG: tRNA-specific adenosine deaminase [archaeon CG07_land_8_20_14_0_80_38_8]PIU88353.1 MAG: tRNA-specific adenosine deaminase [archaeon CG06_land_8_20_14_3_00_37_11]PJA22565.1 MAG: tRNA-specific adenosine deaminase [archaeon CG_4_10_14_0_2_um_filter_Archaea_38_6]